MRQAVRFFFIFREIAVRFPYVFREIASCRNILPCLCPVSSLPLKLYI